MAAPVVNREYSRETKRLTMTDFMATSKGRVDICESNGHGWRYKKRMYSYRARSLSRLGHRQCGFTNRHRVRISAAANFNDSINGCDEKHVYL